MCQNLRHLVGHFDYIFSQLEISTLISCLPETAISAYISWRVGRRVDADRLIMDANVQHSVMPGNGLQDISVNIGVAMTA